MNQDDRIKGDMMVKTVFKRELNHSYLVAEDVPQQVRSSYQYKMILQNRVPGLLVCSERFLEGKACLYYDVSSRQALDQIYDSGKMCFQDIYDVIEETAHLIENMMGYLLDEHFLLINTSMIFMDLETKRLYYAFFPLKEERRYIYSALADFFLEHVNHREEHAVNTAYQFYKQSKSEYFTIQSFIPFLEKEAALADKGRDKDMDGCTYTGMYTDNIETAQSSDLSWKEAPAGGIRNDSAATMEGMQWNGSVCYNSPKDSDRKPERRVYRNTEQGMFHRKATGSRQEKGEDSQTTYKKKGRFHEKKGWGRGIYMIGAAACFLLSISLTFAIWYMRPEGGNRAALVGGTVCCLISMALFLYKWICYGKKNEAEQPVEDSYEEKPVWDTYTQNYDQNIKDETVFLDFDNGRRKIDEVEAGTLAATPRLTGNINGETKIYEMENLPKLAGKREGRVQIILEDSSVSRIHAKFIEQDGRKALLDMNSTNGTYINGIRVEQGEIIGLENGDEIKMGNVKLYYEE